VTKPAAASKAGSSKALDNEAKAAPATKVESNVSAKAAAKPSAKGKKAR